MLDDLWSKAIIINKRRVMSQIVPRLPITLFIAYYMGHKWSFIFREEVNRSKLKNTIDNI